MASRRSSNSALSTGKRPQKTTGCAGLKPGSGHVGAALLGRDRVADAGVAHLLDRGGEETQLAGPELVGRQHLGREDADPVDRVDGARLHHADAVALLQHAVHDAHQHDDAQIGVVPAVDQHRLQRRVALARRRRQAADDRLEHVLDPLPRLGRDQHGLGGVDADDVLDLLLDPLGLGRRQVDLVEDGHDLVVGVDRLVDVGQRLRLDALRHVDDQQRALDGAHRPADLVGEVDMAGRVDQVQRVALAVARGVEQPHGLRLDRDAALALDVHGIEHLLLHLALGHGAGRLDQPVGQRRLAVVDVRDDREVADVREVCHGGAYGAAPLGRQGDPGRDGAGFGPDASG